MATATNRWLDRLAKLQGGSEGAASDYRLAQLLGVPRQTVSNYRTERRQMDDPIAARLAELAGVHPMIVIAEIRAELSRDVRMQRAWDQVAKAAKGGKIAAVILAASLGAATPAESTNWGARMPSPAGQGSPSPSVYYVKRHRRRRFPHFVPGRVKIWNSSAVHHA